MARVWSGPWLREQAAAAWKNPEADRDPDAEPGRELLSAQPAGGRRHAVLWTALLDAQRCAEIPAGGIGHRNWIGYASGAAAGCTRLCGEAGRTTAGPTNATLTSVIREPGPFLRAYDLLLGAGWDPAREGAVYGRELAREMQSKLEKVRVATQAGLHRHLLSEVSRANDPLLAKLLVAGFNAAHWPLWDLLKAVVLAAEQAVVALTDPRYFGESIDQLWIGSWEEITGTETVSSDAFASEILPEEPAAPFAALIASYEKGSPAEVSTSDLTFLVTPDLASQIRAVVLQALDYLRDATRARDWESFFRRQTRWRWVWPRNCGAWVFRSTTASGRSRPAFSSAAAGKAGSSCRKSRACRG